MIIIAESGATKTDWRSISDNGTIYSLRTPGMNVASATPEFISGVLASAIPELDPSGETVTEIHFYAAGLISDGKNVPDSAKNLDAEFHKAFPEGEIEYASDLLDAARAVCGRKPGIAVILGTGSNSCEYDGEKIVKNVRSGGFILGDEGGGACLGKLFMSDFLKGLVPEPLATEFAEKFQVDYLTVVQNVYKGGAPSGYLGSFSPFISSHYNTVPYVKELIDNNFRSLFTRCLSQYDIAGKPVGVVGGFAAAHKETLIRIASEFGVTISEITASPVEGLVRFHTEK